MAGMRRLAEFLSSSIGKKAQMALTGLLLCGFLVAHLGGNLFLFKSREAFNHYAEALEANPLLPLAEIGLLVLFAVHIVMAIWTRVENRRARPERYQVYSASGGRTWGSATMIFTGVLVLAFLIVHLKSFRFASGNEGDLYGLVTRAFRNPAYSAFYVVAMAALALHLSHGFQGGFQTLGFNHPKYTPWVKRLGLAFAVVVCAGFASMPLWFGFLGGGPR
jgi:succinate dehydrogenase / fumarate reductase cytochrome b subunit